MRALWRIVGPLVFSVAVCASLAQGQQPAAKPTYPPAVAVAGAPVAFTTPLYTAVYVPSDSADLNELRREQLELKRLVIALSKKQEDQVNEIRALRAQLTAAAAPPSSQAPPPSAVPSAAGVQPTGALPKALGATAEAAKKIITQRCASCHGTAAIARGEGGGLELIRDGVLDVPDKDTLKAIRNAIKDGNMPPPKRGGALAADEKEALLLHYSDPKE